jgi:hypothetical protein
VIREIINSREQNIEKSSYFIPPNQLLSLTSMLAYSIIVSFQPPFVIFSIFPSSENEALFLSLSLSLSALYSVFFSPSFPYVRPYSAAKLSMFSRELADSSQFLSIQRERVREGERG